MIQRRSIRTNKNSMWSRRVRSLLVFIYKLFKKIRWNVKKGVLKQIYNFIQICFLTRIHTHFVKNKCIRTHTHTYVRARTHTLSIFAQRHILTQVYSNRDTRTITCAKHRRTHRTHTHTHARTHARTHAHTHTHIHSRTHASVHSRTHIHTHIYTLIFIYIYIAWNV